MKQPITWIMFYAHRILRLTPPYMLFICFVIAYIKHVGHSPVPILNLWNVQEKQCRESWWKNLLYINNFYDADTQCYGIVWYLAVDMQIHVMAPLILIPLFYSRLAGGIAASMLFAFNIAYTYGIYFHYKLAPSSVGDDDPKGNFMKKAYQMPWVRFTPYLIGVLTGYFMHKTSAKRLKLNWIAIGCMWILATALALTVLLGLHGYFNGHQLTEFEKASYYIFSRIGWAVSLSWLVIAVQHDWAGRLTYCTYLVHYFVLVAYMSIPEYPPHYDSVIYFYISFAIPIIALSIATAFIWSCMYEIPSMKLEKIVIEKLLTGQSKHGKKDDELNSSKIADIDTNPEELAPSEAEGVRM